MKKIVLFLMIVFSVSLFATDVSNFDSKGIKLGMSKNEVLKLMPKGTKFREDDCLDSKCEYPTAYFAYFEDVKSRLNVYFTHTLQSYKIERYIKLDNRANIGKIALSIKNRYGKPDYTWKVNNNLWKFCWGECKRGEYHFLTKKNGKTLYIEIDTNVHFLTVELEDEKLYRMNYNYREKIEKELEEKASQVDL